MRTEKKIKEITTIPLISVVQLQRSLYCSIAEKFVQSRINPFISVINSSSF